VQALDPFRAAPTGTTMTTDQGLPIVHTDDSLKAGLRGPTLLEDFHLREKITRFDHERIPERVVHARGAGAHGFFQLYEPLPKLSKAAFLNDTQAQTPVFVRFSTVAGSRGSADTVRDVRGFATKFYTNEGNFDLVGNNMPVFFIQDGIKFPDLIHAVKPEPANEMPQAASAHDSFWDFVSLMPESAHMIMWHLSDRGLPRSYRMMEGFGVHTFRLVNAAGKSRLVKFHWKPLLGAHALVWDEAQKLAGKDADFHRRDLWNAIEMGAFPEWELGVQVMNEGDETKYGFDLLDPTKLVPEELVPVQRIGKMTLNRNPQNFFAETEQIAFHVGNLVPGIDITNDPLMQARLFSYLDTQLTRLGGPNFAEIPINRPIVPVRNHQQDGLHRDTINTGAANYHPNSIGGGCPFLADPKVGFSHFPQPVEGEKARARSPSFLDHYSQATLFLRSQSAAERRHLVDACKFELGKVTRPQIRERVLGIFREIDPALAEEVARGIGVAVPKGPTPPPRGTAVPKFRGDNGGIKVSPALSLMNQPHTSIATRKIAFLCEDGFTDDDVAVVKRALETKGAVVEIVSSALGHVKGAAGAAVPVDKTFLTAASVFYDAVYVPGGEDSVALLSGFDEAGEFLREAFKHNKTIAASGEGVELLSELRGVALAEEESKELTDDNGVVTTREGKRGPFANAFIAAIAEHRHFGR
jgi:catalase